MFSLFSFRFLLLTLVSESCLVRRRLGRRLQRDEDGREDFSTAFVEVNDRWCSLIDERARP